ncbi:glycosyltransferase family 2 protein [Fimbriimonas ginsengisoli]|uniref:glycosyltransferase family 2 protein n=1 Tax=Fimbriimonas ginsengisoli TaxID=1005039 RepID=UPI00046D5A7E|nr:glycosyltransferase family 2 protein [Fimbriimonas ginsengisoli]
MAQRVSVLVVSFNTIEKLRRCLQCIEPHHEVVVVDNASEDGSVEMVQREFPHVRLQVNAGNVGFGVANNQAAAIATGDLLLYLNSDAYAFPGAIDTLALACHDPAVVAAGGELQYLDGRLQESIAGRLTLAKVFLEQTWLDPLFRKLGLRIGYWRTTAVHEEWERTQAPVPVDQIMGACLMVRPNLESFDPRYFMYCEDTDLCLRLSRHGRLVYDAAAKFYHELGSSSAKDPAVGIMRYNWGKELFFRIHRGPLAEVICLLLDRGGALLRLLVWAAAFPLKPQQSRTAVGIWRRVLTAPRRSAAGSTHTPAPPRPADQSS